MRVKSIVFGAFIFVIMFGLPYVVISEAYRQDCVNNKADLFCIENDYYRGVIVYEYSGDAKMEVLCIRYVNGEKEEHYYVVEK